MAVLCCGLAAADDRPAASFPLAAPDPSPDAPPLLPLAAPDPEVEVDPRELAALVEQLGHDAFDVRQAAFERLSSLGLAARPALVGALQHADPEVRTRARRCLGEILDADQRARVEAFVADVEGRLEHDLPGWKRFQAAIGRDKQSRSLFAQMLREEPGLLETAGAGGPQTAESLLLRCQQLQQLQSASDPKLRRQPSVGNVAALIFVGSDPDVEYSDGTYFQIYNFIVQSPFQQALAGSPFTAQVRKLLGIWIARTAGTSVAYQNMRLAMQYDLREGLPAAIKLAADPNAAGYTRLYGVLAIGKLGTAKNVADLNPLLEDKTSCLSRTQIRDGNRIELRTELRDAALAALIHLARQRHQDFGFKGLSTNAQTLFNTSTIYFESDEEREAAHKKWKEWAAANPIVDPPAAGQPQGAKQPEPPAPPAAGAQILGRAPLGNVALQIAPRQPNDPAVEAGFLVVDRQAKVRLSRARQLIANQQYDEAVQLIDTVLEADGGGSFRDDRPWPIYRSLSSAALRLIETLPPPGQQAYQFQFGPIAQRLLDDAIRHGDLDLLKRVARRYFLTSAGSRAAWLWATHLFETGQPLPAAILLQRLAGGPFGEEFEPALTSKLIASWLAAGLPDQAAAQLVRSRAARPAARLKLGSKEIPPLSDAGAAERWLAEAGGRLSQLVPAGSWTVFRGDAARNAHAACGDPWLHGLWHLEMTELPPVREAIGQLQLAYQSEHLPALPASHPLAVGEIVLVRTIGRLEALRVQSGVRAWFVPFRDSVEDLLQTLPGANLAGSPQLFDGLDERLWADSTYGQMSSDGRYVFGVEDVGFAYGLLNQRMVVMPDGSRRLDPGWPRDYNRLTAYDISTGKLKWEIGGPPSEKLELSGGYFLGPPLPLADRLYVVAEFTPRIDLLTLDPRSGRLLARQTIDAVDKDGSGPQNGVVVYNGNLPRRFPRRMAGASPSYTDGVLVCPTSRDTFTAVDLASGTILWSYHPGVIENGPNLANPFVRMGAIRPPADHRDVRWTDCSVTIAAGRVLLTPAASERLFCLGLSDGELLWEAPRLDSQYVAQVHEGVVMLVGRGKVRGLKLADGTDAWPALKLPPDSAPSGRGFASGKRYYLPLSTAEIAAIDISTGRLLRRSKSRHGHVPGNLIGCNQRIVSQSIDGVQAFDSLDEALHGLSSRLAADPANAELLHDQAEVLLFLGRFAEAIDVLKRGLQIRPSEKSKALLADVLLEALQFDYAAYRETAVSLADVLQTPEQRWAYWRITAEALRKQGRSLDALAAYLRLIDLSDQTERLEPIESGLWVRRERWIEGQLRDLRQECAAEDRPAFDKLIAERLHAASDPAALRRLVPYFDGHPAAEAARDRLLVAAATAGEASLEAELLALRQSQSSHAPRARAAVARLAELLARHDRPQEAAELYRRLGSALADEECLPGQTGRQLVGALPGDSPVRALLEGPDPWPLGAEIAASSNTPRTVTQRQFSLEIEAAEHPLLGEMSLEVEQAATQRIVCRDGLGQVVWSVELPAVNANNSVAYNPSLVRARLYGHLLLVWRGYELYCLDTLHTGGAAARLLWSKDLATKFPGESVTNSIGARMFQPPGMRPRMRAIDPQGRSLPEMGPLASTHVCYLRLRTLTAADPLTGTPLWVRRDVRLGSQLLGDDEFIFVVPPDSTEAIVLRAADGQELGRRNVPDEPNRLAVLGRNVLTWSEAQDKARLSLVDLWTGASLWSREFPSGTKTWLAALDEVAVCDRQGRFEVLWVPDGQRRLQAQLGPLPELRDIVLLRSRHHYVLCANEPPRGAAAVRIFGGYPQIQVSGKLFGFDRASGKKLWQAEIGQQGLELQQPADLPIVTFSIRGYEQQENGRIGSPFSSVQCLDRRTGKFVFEERAENYAVSRVELVPDLPNRTIEVRTSRSSNLLKFTAADPAEENQP
jgi:outer membrane protein assembly factor BamB